MRDYHRFPLEIIKNTSILALLLLTLALLIGRTPLAIGIFLGSCVAIFNFFRLSMTTYTFVVNQKRPLFLFLQYISRYLLTGLVLFISLEFGLTAFFGAFLGLLLPKFYIMYRYLLTYKGG